MKPVYCFCRKQAPSKIVYRVLYTLLKRIEVKDLYKIIRNSFRSGIFCRECQCLKSAEIRSFFRSVFFHIWTEYGEIRTRKNSGFGHFLHSVLWRRCVFLLLKKSKDFGYLVETGFISKTFSKSEIKGRITTHPFLLNASNKNNGFLTLSWPRSLYIETRP